MYTSLKLNEGLARMAMTKKSTRQELVGVKLVEDHQRQSTTCTMTSKETEGERSQ
jgi:hypothetical protein